MSIKIMDWVFENSKSQGIERLILLVIADHCNSEGEDAFPRISLIAKRANVSERTVKRRLQDLVELGELEVVKRQGTSSLYKIITTQSSPPSKVIVPLEPKKKATKTRERNPIWDTLLEVCGVDPHKKVNSSEASRYGRLVKLLNELEATPDDIRARAAVYKEKFSYATMTPSALVNRWSECDPASQPTNGLNGVVPKGWNAIKAAREQRLSQTVAVKGELNV
jgi:DNA-binding transcriptional regulator YhcF (GntR family)